MISLLASALLCWDPSPGAPAAPLRPNLNVEDRPRYFVRRLEPLPTPTFSDIADKLFGVTTVIDLGDAPSHAPAAHGRASFDAPSIQGRASTDAPTYATLGSPSVTVDIPSSADTLRGHPLRTPSASLAIPGSHGPKCRSPRSRGSKRRPGSLSGTTIWVVMSTSGDQSSCVSARGGT